MKHKMLFLILISIITISSWSAQSAYGMEDNPSPIKSIYVWPQIPVPNGTVDFTVVAPNQTQMMIQICINTMCFIPQLMNYHGNGTFTYHLVPRTGRYPPTKNGDKIFYHILIGGKEVANGNITVKKNNPPEIHDIFLNSKHVNVGNTVEIMANVTDDYEVHNVTCYITTPDGEENKYPMTPQNNNSSNNTYFTSIKISEEGNYFIKIVAYDNSNQTTIRTSSFFVYPPKPVDKTPPKVIDAYGLLNGTKLIITVYLQDNSGISLAKIEFNSTWYKLTEISPGVFEIVFHNITPPHKIKVYVKDPYNNTFNKTIVLKTYDITPPSTNTSNPANENPNNLGVPWVFLILGILIGILIILPLKNKKLIFSFILIISIASLIISIAYSYPLIARDAGGNIFNGNTCWSCLGLQPNSAPKGWLINYPNGTPVKHPGWILNMLKSKPVFIFVHQVPCTGCEIQWKDMIKAGIITKDGHLTLKYQGKINFVVLDVTYNSPTREKGMEILKTYSLGQIGTPTTIILTKHGNTIYWFSKSGIVYHSKLEELLNKAIEMYR